MYRQITAPDLFCPHEYLFVQTIDTVNIAEDDNLCFT